jgi:outer membrane protein assembly factor BamB
VFVGLCVAVLGNLGASRARPSGSPNERGSGSTTTSAPLATSATSSTASTATTTAGYSGASQASSPAELFSGPQRHLRAGPNLLAGSDPSVLPADVLIADRSNSRLLIVDPTGRIVWQFPRPGDLRPGQTFKIPDDAFFTPDGSEILATQEDDQVISLIDVQTHRIVWQYGTPGVPGMGPNHVWNPDDAMDLPNGEIVLADIKNCSLLVLRPPSHLPVERIGEATNACTHEPPLRWGSPNGMFPLTDHDYLVTEINGDWVDELTPAGKVLWSTNPPGVAYPSDTNEVAPNRYLTVDYSDPGQIVEFDRNGHLLYRYAPASGAGKLNQPSLCVPVPASHDILCNDDFNDRVIVVDPRTGRIVWQYGHDAVSGTAEGYLDRPDGVDLVPPYSMDVTHAATMGRPTARCVASDPSGTCTFGAAAARAAG